MKLSDMKTNQQVLAEQIETDPVFRAEWERTALARAVALIVLRFRSDNDLSQTELGKRLGMAQPQVARIESGEVNPSIETLMRLSAELGVEFNIDVRPAGTPARFSTDEARTAASRSEVHNDLVSVLVAATA